MLKGNLIEALKTFTPKEMREFSGFVNSSYFIKNKKVKKLFDIIKNYYPEFNSNKLNKEKVFEKIYGNESYKDSKMRILMFYLYEVVEKFLVYNRIVNNETVFKEFVVKELHERNLHKDFEKTCRQALMDIDKGTIVNADYYMNKFTFQYEYLNYLCTAQTDQYGKFMNEENIEKVFNNLTYYYIIMVFKFYSIVLTTKTLYNTNIETVLFEKITNTYDANLFKDVPLINIYYNAVMCLLEPDEEKYYFNMKKLVFENNDNISSNDLLNLYINLENYCTRKTITGNTAYLKEGFEILKKEIDYKIYRTGGFMSPLFYRSSFVIGMKLKETEWAQNFIEKYRSELDNENRDSVYYYCMAYMQETEGNYEKGLDYLAKARTEEHYLKTEIKLLQCKLFYMLDWNIPLTSMIETFKRTLKNDKLIPEKRKLLYLKFAKYLNKINNIKEKPDNNKTADLKKEIICDDDFVLKSWILNRISELPVH